MTVSDSELFKLQRTELATTHIRAPWSDFALNEIYEGDIIQHPDGMQGVVVFLPYAGEPADQWRVKYHDQAALSRLVLQIGDKGQAVVIGHPLEHLTLATTVSP